MKLSAIAISLLFPFVARAGEHPKGHEHPKSQEQPKAQEHPKGHEHPKEHPENKAGAPSAKPEDVQQVFTGVVEDYLKEQYKAGGGALVIADEKTGKKRKLKLKHLHKNKIVKLSEDEAFACADFKTVKDGKDAVDLDFYVSRSGDDWKVSKVLIHKVNTKPRYTYDDANRMVPVQ